MTTRTVIIAVGIWLALTLATLSAIALFGEDGRVSITVEPTPILIE
jgi:hypothetical protein